ncbi:hypothetical protein PUR61_02610 [Streptomyces sp. BE20]|uniref:hypothetical protein n=1 Tax=Streptomyces sp. BE20 TaxID=3002525 RepID=UPI002E7A6ED1|nr:hypothetical protein [Streptomyces sp. BE20]MEE1821098.1 hypothetical protein [Streptomyces sp. BE20]
MTAAVPFSRPAHPAPMPGDAERAPRELMTLPGASRDVRRWRLVEVRLGGGWRPGMLTVWRRPPGSAMWVVHVRWAADGTVDQGWGWFLFDPEQIRPLPEPAGPPPTTVPYFGQWQDAVVVPAELAGTPDPDGGDRCWRLAWLRAAGEWRSALVTARRRPGPGLPWIAHARWGEDRAAAWVIADPAALQPLPAAGYPVTPARPADDGPVPGADAATGGACT